MTEREFGKKISKVWTRIPLMEKKSSNIYIFPNVTVEKMRKYEKKYNDGKNIYPKLRPSRGVFETPRED